MNVVVSDTKGLNGPMTMTVTPSTVPAGDVTFVVKNTGTIDHEAVVLKLDPGQTWDKLPITYAGDPPAPVTTGADKVDEANNIGETGDPNLQARQHPHVRDQEHDGRQLRHRVQHRPALRDGHACAAHGVVSRRRRTSRDRVARVRAGLGARRS